MIFEEKWQKIIIVGFFLVVYGSKKTPWSLIMPFFVEKECISNAQGLLVWGVTSRIFTKIDKFDPISTLSKRHIEQYPS